MLMELDVILNRLYLRYYKHPTEFWKELGSIFINVRKQYERETSSLRIMGNTLRELAVFLYQDWYQKASQDLNQTEGITVNLPKLISDEWKPPKPDLPEEEKDAEDLAKAAEEVIDNNEEPPNPESEPKVENPSPPAVDN